MTWLSFLNVYFFRWTFFRLARVIEQGRQTGWTIVGPMSPFANYYEPRKPANTVGSTTDKP